MQTYILMNKERGTFVRLERAKPVETRDVGKANVWTSYKRAQAALRSLPKKFRTGYTVEFFVDTEPMPEYTLEPAKKEPERQATATATQKPKSAAAEPPKPTAPKPTEKKIPAPAPETQVKKEAPKPTTKLTAFNMPNPNQIDFRRVPTDLDDLNSVPSLEQLKSAVMAPTLVRSPIQMPGITLDRNKVKDDIPTEVQAEAEKPVEATSEHTPKPEPEPEPEPEPQPEPKKAKPKAPVAPSKPIKPAEQKPEQKPVKKAVEAGKKTADLKLSKSVSNLVNKADTIQQNCNSVMEAECDYRNAVTAFLQAANSLINAADTLTVKADTLTQLQNDAKECLGEIGVHIGANPDAAPEEAMALYSAMNKLIGVRGTSDRAMARIKDSRAQRLWVDELAAKINNLTES